MTNDTTTGHRHRIWDLPTEADALEAADAMDRLVRSLSGANVTPTEFRVLVDLGLYAVAREDRPSDAVLAANVNVSVRHLRRVLGSLVDKGWLADVHGLPEVKA